MISLSAFALGELKRQHNLSDIIERLCQRTVWDWEEAEQFLISVRVENYAQLEAHKNRLSILVSLLVIGGGMLNLAIFCLWVFYNPRTAEVLLPNDQEQGILTLLNQLALLAIRSPLAYVFYGVALTGIGMIIGGMIGLVRPLCVGRPRGFDKGDSPIEGS